MNLYEINAQIQEILETMINPETGEIVETVVDALKALTIESDGKIENIACYIKNLTAEKKALTDEILALTIRKRQKQRKIANLKNYLASVMALMGQDKIETTRAVLSFRRSTAVTITEADKIPAEFIKQKPPEFDVSEIKKRLASGQAVPGAELEIRQNLQVR